MALRALTNDERDGLNVISVLARADGDDYWCRVSRSNCLRCGGPRFEWVRQQSSGYMLCALCLAKAIPPTRANFHPSLLLLYRQLMALYER